MKKIFSLFAAVLFAGSMMAGEVTVSKTVQDRFPNDANGTQEPTLYSDANLSISVNADGNNGKVYGTGTEWRLYQTNSAVVTVQATNATIKTVAFEFTVKNTGILKFGDNVMESGTAVNVNAASAQFVVANSGAATNGQVIIKSFTVVYETAGGTPAATVDDPVFDPAKGDFEESVDVKITCGTQDAKVYYTLDGAEPTASSTEYTKAITLTATTTIKAIAIKGDDKSKVVSKTYTKVEPLADPTNCAEAAQAALSVSANNELYNNGKEYTIEGYVTEIAYAWKDKSMSFWMADTKDGGKVLEAYKCAIEDEADAVRVGDKVKVTGKLTKFNTTPEFATGCTVQMIERAQVVDPVNLGEKTIAEFLELKNTKDTCILSGVVDNITNTKYGNFDLLEIGKPETKVYVYGLLTAAGEAQKFADLDIAAGDTLTIKAIYYEFNNKPQITNAIFVSVKKSTAPVVDPVNLGKKTIAEFLELKNTKDTCILTGVIDNVVNDEYGNFNLIDETDTVYVYGLLNEAGEARKCFKDKELAEGDTLTILALYNEFNGAPQVKNAIFVSVAKKAEAKPEVEVEYDEIVFAEAVAANDLAENASFTVEGSQFSATIADADNKMAIDANACRFGTAEDYTTYQFRLKSGGASGADKNFITLNIPEAGKLRIAARSANSSATDRALVIKQGETELYNDIVMDTQAIEVTEGEATVKVFPYVEVAVAAGSVVVRYSAALNFYSFGFLADAKPTAVEAIEGQNSKVEIVKVIRDGQLLIICGDKTYNVLGTVIR